MRRQRATRTDRLLNIIGVIELGRRTGLLSIERDEPFTTEEGDIYFLAGEAIYASTSTESGRAALNTMRSWGACRFAFLADIPRPVPNIGPEVRGVRPQQTGALRPPTSGPMPSAQPSQRSGPLDPPAQRSGPLARTPSGQIISSPPTSPPANAPRQVSKQQMEQYPSRITGSFQSPPAVPPVTPPPGFPAPSQLLPIARSHRPRRAPNPQDIPRLAATYHLSWAHRTLLLLADGEHTIVDLARLARRSEEEVVTLLADLIRLGLVSLL